MFFIKCAVVFAAFLQLAQPALAAVLRVKSADSLLGKIRAAQQVEIAQQKEVEDAPILWSHLPNVPQPSRVLKVPDVDPGPAVVPNPPPLGLPQPTAPPMMNEFGVVSVAPAGMEGWYATLAPTPFNAWERYFKPCLGGPAPCPYPNLMR